MKIAIWHNLPSGGGKRALYCHVTALLKAGHYVEVWTSDMSSDSYLPLSKLVKEHRKPVKNEIEKNNTVRNILTREQKNIEVIEKHCIECAKEMEEAGFDLLFANSCSFSYMPYIGRFTKLPSIVYLGEPFRPLHEAMPENTWIAHYDKLSLKKIKRLYRDFFVNYSKRLRVKKEIEAARSFKKILVNSLFSRENVIRAYGIDASVCYLGIDTSFFSSKEISIKEAYVVGVGSIGRIKGVHKAIEIISKIPENKRPELKWIANGFDPGYFNDCVELAKVKQVIFQPLINISDKILIATISKAAVMIYTSHLEPFGLAPLEANACGTYVVAIAEGGVRESITNNVNGTLINNYNLFEFKDEIVRFLDDLGFSKKKGNEARLFVMQNWNLSKMENNICKVIEAMLD